MITSQKKSKAVMKTESYEHARSHVKIQKAKVTFPSLRCNMPQRILLHYSLGFPATLQLLSLTWGRSTNWLCTRSVHHLSPHEYYAHLRWKQIQFVLPTQTLFYFRAWTGFPSKSGARFWHTMPIRCGMQLTLEEISTVNPHHQDDDDENIRKKR